MQSQAAESSTPVGRKAGLRPPQLATGQEYNACAATSNCHTQPKQVGNCIDGLLLAKYSVSYNLNHLNARRFSTAINMIRSWRSSSAGAGSSAPLVARSALPVQTPTANRKIHKRCVSSAKCKVKMGTQESWGIEI